MGTLLYGAQARPIDIGDRLLAHVEIAILSRLRRDEPFASSRGNAVDEARRTVWVHPTTELMFVYAENGPRRINRAWVELLASGADRGFLRLQPEPSASHYLATLA